MGLPTAAEWAARARLQRRASEWVGSCPLCAGKDRFHVRQTDSSCRVGCRGCIDGQAPAVKAERFGQLLAQLFPERSKWQHRRRTPVPQGNVHGASPRQPESDLRPALLWNCGNSVADTPAGQYLLRRRVHPPGQAFPHDIRWISSVAWPAGLPRDVPTKLRVPPLPAGSAGCLSFAWKRIDGTGLPAVSCEALTAAGQRLAKRWRRTFGSKSGALFFARRAGSGRSAITEGELDALAACWLLQESASVAAAGGTSGLTALGLPDSGAGWILLPDGDPVGLAAAQQLHAAHPKLIVRWRGLDGGDPASDLAEEIGERLALRSERAPSEPEPNLTAAWADFWQTRRGP